MRLVIVILSALCLLPVAAFGQLTISRPNDTIVNGATTTVTGNGVPNGSSVSVKVGNVTKTGIAAGGTWTVVGLPLAKGDNVITARSGTATTSAMVIRSTALTGQGTQRVFFDWDTNVDDELRSIARGTLTATLTDAQLASFIDRVKVRTQEIFADRYRPFGVQLVLASGPGVHTVHMTAISDSDYGLSTGDCGSLHPTQTSSIHVGTYRADMVNRFSRWGPMRKTDSLDTRIEDVAQALGRTTAHETGHSLGLDICGFMHGCDGGHNCDSYDASHPLADRFNHGRHIMDPGGKTFNNFRLGEPNATSRATVRQPSWWEPFGQSYLAIVHPGGG
jgi:hypothetical protein